MVLVRTSSAAKDFEELLSTLWARQLARLRLRPDSGEWQADPDSQKANEEEGDAR